MLNKNSKQEIISNHFPLLEPVITPSRNVSKSIITTGGSPSFLLVLTKSIGSYPCQKIMSPTMSEGVGVL